MDVDRDRSVTMRWLDETGIEFVIGLVAGALIVIGWILKHRGS